MIYNECKVVKFELITVTLAVTLKNPFVAVEMSPLVFALIIKNTCPDFFLKARLIRTPG